MILLRRLVEAELFDKLRVDRVLAAPVAEDVPGDLRRTSDEEFEAPDVRVVVSARRGREEDGAPPQSKAPVLASFVTISCVTSNASRRVVGQWGGAGGASCEDHLALAGGRGALRALWKLCPNQIGFYTLAAVDAAPRI